MSYAKLHDQFKFSMVALQRISNHLWGRRPAQEIPSENGGF